MSSIGDSLLFKILQEERMREFSKLRREWFVNEEQESFDMISAFVGDYGKLPTSDTFIATRKIMVLPPNEPFGYFQDEFVNRVVYNTIKSKASSIERAMKSRDGKGVVAILKEITELADSVNQESNRDVIQMHELGDRVLERLREARLVNGMTGVPTGWETLDRATNGLQNGDVILVLARLKMGKSRVMDIMADAAYDAGLPPMLVSMEMTGEQMGARVFARRAHINMTDVLRGTVSTFAEGLLIEKVNEARQGTPYFFVEGQLRKDVRELGALIHAYKPAALYIDAGYLLRLQGAERKAKWERMTDIVEIIKAVAAQQGIPVVVSFQFNRSVNRKNTKSMDTESLDKIQLSDAIGQIATTGVALMEDDEGQDNVRIMEITGGRNGEKGRWKINWDWERQNYSEISEIAPNQNESVFNSMTDEILVW